MTEGRIGLDESRYSVEIANFISSGVATNRSVNRQNFPGLTLKKFSEIASGFPKLLEQIVAGNLEQYFDFVGSIVRACFDEDCVLILNNDPPGHHFWGTNKVPASTVVPVVRASRDIIADRLERDRVRGEMSRQLGWSRAAFIFLSGFRLVRVGKRFQRMGIPAMSYEHLVLSRLAREDFFLGLGFHYEERAERRFVSSESTSHIGIHQSGLSWGDELVLFLGETIARLLPNPTVRADFSIWNRQSLKKN